eukprot:9728381-Alexandrium_andersonii.AAC.1
MLHGCSLDCNMNVRVHGVMEFSVLDFPYQMLRPRILQVGQEAKYCARQLQRPSFEGPTPDWELGMKAIKAFSPEQQ